MTSTQAPIQIGMNGRQFPANYRPILDDIAFARKHGFAAIQVHGQPNGLGGDRLGAPPEDVGRALRAAGVAAVMEIIIWMGRGGRLLSGQTPLAVLEANLPAVTALGCTHVHWHIGLAEPLDGPTCRELERDAAPQFAAALALARQHGFQFAVEHNEPGIGLFDTPDRTAALLEAVPGLGLVWDLNHTQPDDLDAYLTLAPRMTMLHLADTPLPQTNHHLPLGLGTIDFAAYFRALVERGFRGPAILEIGGLPKSGGYGRDTDAALVRSREVALAALAAVQ